MWITFLTAKHCFSTLLQSYCDYLLKMGRIDEAQAVIEQLIVSDFKKSGSTALKTFNNYTVKITKNSDKIGMWCFRLCSLFLSKLNMFLWWIYGVFKHFHNLENLILNIWNNCISLALWDLFYLKPCRAFRITQSKQSRLVKHV